MYTHNTQHQPQSAAGGGITFALLATGIALSAFCSAGTAQAQSNNAADEPIDEIVVTTARRREESLLEVPVAISVFTGDELERIGAVDIIAVAQASPNVTLEVSRGTNIRVNRGRDASVFSGTVSRMLADWPRFTRIFVPRIFAHGGAEQQQALVDWMVTETEKNHPQSMAQLWMSIGEQDFRNDLANLQLPTLITYGARSQLYRAEASEWITNNIPNATGVGFADSGHAPHLEEPDLFNKEIESFARQTEI